MRLLSLLLLALLPALALAAPSAPAPASAELVVVVEGPDGGLADAPGSLVAPVAPSAAISGALPSAAASVAPPSAPGSLVEIPGVVVTSDTPFPGDDDVFGHGKEALEAVKASRRAPTVAGVAAAIVAGIMLLISVARRFGGLLLTSNQVRLFVVCAAALAAGIAKVSDGMGWTEILFVALAPVVSVGMHQVFVKPVTKKKG